MMAARIALAVLATGALPAFAERIDKPNIGSEQSARSDSARVPVLTNTDFCTSLMSFRMTWRQCVLRRVWDAYFTLDTQR